MAEIFFPDGTIRSVFPRDLETGFTLDEVKELLGFDDNMLVQQLHMGDGNALLIDEEGKLDFQRHPLNLGATSYARAHGALAAGDYIVGPALRVHCWGQTWR